MYEKHQPEPDPGRNDAAHRPRVSGGNSATKPAAFCLRLRAGSHREARQTQKSLRSSGWNAGHDERLVTSSAGTGEPDKEVVDWDLYLGPAAWRPFNEKLLDGFNFEKGGGLVGGGVLEWGSHCVDLCQWAVGDCLPPVEYNAPEDGQLVARYENGIELIFREKGWIPLGSCPVRFEGETGWVEAGDSGQMVLSSPELRAGREVAEIGGYPATFHVRDFLDCVKTRSQPKGNADAACNAHIACPRVTRPTSRCIWDAKSSTTTQLTLSLTTNRPIVCARKHCGNRGDCDRVA